jgi:hypothetical protein
MLASSSLSARIAMRSLFRQIAWAHAALLVAPLASHAQPPPPAFAAPAIAQAQQLRAFTDPNVAPAAPAATAATSVASLPATLGASQTFADAAGQTGSVLAIAPVQTANDAFFQSLGSNGRFCGSCHQDQSNWTLSPPVIQAIFTATGGTDPLFRRIDGATCPTANVSTAAALQTAYSLLLNRGLIRIGLPVPTSAQFAVTAVNDPYKCTTSPTTGLTSPTSGIVSVYRRPLPTTNLRFETVLMWDGRETSLTQQATDATLIHAQAFTAPTAAQLAQITAFESALTTAQVSGIAAQSLSLQGATGGPAALATETLKVASPPPQPANSFTLFAAWAGLTGSDATTQARLSIARGEAIFNTRPIAITGVAGFNNSVVNGVSVEPTFKGACSTCHNIVNAGGNSLALKLDIGVTGSAPPALNVAGLPQFTLHCASGSLAGQTSVVTDPGVALISGQCADIGKTKVPTLRGLAARPPYFHNGSAAQLADVVNFYDQRFRLGLAPQEKTDLVNFLSSL